MITTETPVWQRLMDAAYDRWKAHEGWRYENMLLTASGAERMAVLLGNLNYQVENGGFTQWVDNGYALKGQEVVLILRQLAEEENCPIANELADKIEQLLRFVNLGQKNQGFSNYWKDEYWRDEPGDSDEGEEHVGVEFATSLDDWYYDVVQPLLCPAIERFLATLNESK